MKQLFNLDSPVMRFLAKMCDLMILNVLFLFTSIPIVTMGAAMAAMDKVTQDIAFESDGGIFMPYCRAFKENLKQGTGAWLIVLLIFTVLIMSLLLTVAYLDGLMKTVVTVAGGAALSIAAGITSYLFPLIARYQNSLRQHFVNATLLAVIKLPRTVLMVAINLLPVIIFIASPVVFAATMIVWAGIGFGLQSFLCSKLLVPVFTEFDSAGRESEETEE